MIHIMVQDIYWLFFWLTNSQLPPYSVLDKMKLVLTLFLQDGF
jgi:hypothetical protein